MQACKEDIHSPINQGGEVPSPIKNPVVESLPGAGKITYQLPSDENLLCVKATYEAPIGVTREVKASYYTNNMIVEGFGDTLEHKVSLCTVGRNNLESSPVTVTLKPQTPSIVGIFKSITESIRETYGGIKFNVDNPGEADVRIYVSTTDSIGEWIAAETFYTSTAKVDFSVRGYDSIARPFRINVKDRWDNSSDTYENTFHPWFEEKLDKTKFRQVTLPTDQNTPHMTGRTMDRIWDESYSNTDFVTTVGYGIPQWFTFDLGVTARLSRIVVYNRSSGATYIYNAGSIKEWEIFGSMNPNPDGSFDSSWIPMRKEPCVSFKPSGLPVGEYSNEDIQRQIDGEEFEFDANEVPVRYLRWKTNAVWGGTSIGHINLVEITLYGSVVKGNN
ncbi:MAG: hypothetical protein A2W90_09145 [Bacteroidetes bacterium GWF2_42_66]|nr:MAG: hypothetical protein A2W92_12120 [Bacteroidetes bacterium GWA2_42_15]OFY00573.1 MAG: hypothetical protein A2W89_20460 [Bacteroidetes bacterium GWE2_42_39]OFY42307.1 MAG: hypothetical protein A2W90_09145 [Bacteroidetes bacterium GWF2_42_66]